MERPTVDVVIPTYKPGKIFEELLRRLSRQTYPVTKIVIMNTEEQYWQRRWEQEYPILQVHHLDKAAFDHGGTRAEAARLCNSEYMICMTQDAMPADSRLVENLLKPLISGEAQASYARQLPAKDCHLIERLTGQGRTHLFVYTKVGTAKYIKTCEITVTARLGDNVETFENLSLKPGALNNICVKTAKSDLITVEVLEIKAAAPAPAKEKDKDGKEAPAPAPKAAPIVPYDLCGGTGSELVLTLQGGSNGSVLTASSDTFLGKDDGPGRRTGLQAFLENSNVSIMAIPGITAPEVQAALIGFCESKKSCFAILDVPMELKKTNDVANFRDMYDSTYAAMYHPWLEMYDAGAKRSAYFPPSGAMAGIYARTDIERGVHKAPANEVVRGCTGLSCAYNEGEQDILNPIGVNLIRAFTGRGIRVWGARTISSNGLWKYLNVRRLFIYVEESIKANTNWVVFEPNSTTLWSRVTRTIETFLATCWRDGALAGSTPSEAFFVECGPTTMTQDDIDNGRLICQIGIAPVKPAEFVIFRITQKTASE